jgi:Type I phosphodiesterase / nucleotide pyrophosphatase
MRHSDIQAQQPNLEIVRPRSLEALSCAAVDQCKFDQGFVRPAYENFCFSRLPGFTETVLLGTSNLPTLPPEVHDAVASFHRPGLQSFDHVVFVFFDAFGWESLQRFRESSLFLQQFDQRGLVAKTTSQFPSATAAHIATSFCGLPAYEHMVCGWDYYEPNVGRMIRPLKFAFTDEPQPDSLRRAGVSPEKVLPPSRIIPVLTSQGVTVRFRGPQEYYASTFNTAYGESEGYRSLDHGVAQVVDLIKAGPHKSYQHLYIDSYDSTCHKFGIGAPQSDEVARKALESLRGLLQDASLPPTLLIVSADHGHIKSPPQNAIPLNVVVPGIEDLLKRDSRGAPIRFSGGLRHLFLHPEPQYQEHLVAELRGKLHGAANVMTLPELQTAGLLGPKAIDQSFADRLGTIGILPYAGHSVYWFEPPLFQYGDASHHGGASFQEMETPLLMMPLGV